MAANVAKAGFTLTVHNRSRGKAAALEEAGARWAATPSEAVDHAAVVCICLPDTPDVEAVLFGPEGVASSVPHGAIVVDVSTIAAVPTANFARRLLAVRGARRVVGDDGDGALGRDGLAKGIGFIGGVGHDDFGGQALDQGVGLRAVAALPAGECRAHRQAQAAHGQVDLGAQAPAGAAQGLWS